MSNSRDAILSMLRAGKRPFAGVNRPTTYQPMVPRAAVDASTLKAQFVEEAQKLSCQVHCAASPAQALETLLALLEGNDAISCWDAAQIPLNGLAEALQAAGITTTNFDDPAAGIGLSGAQAALAATGSLVLCSGPGRYRASSLLPPVHVAVVHEAQILPDLEHWFALQREDGFKQLRQSSNIVVISGPSRTADIAMELVMGMHGPRELHVVLLEEAR